MGSKKYTLDGTDWVKVGVGMLVALGGVAVEQLYSIATDTDFGQWTPIAVAVSATLVNMARKFLKDNTPK